MFPEKQANGDQVKLGQKLVHCNAKYVFKQYLNAFIYIFDVTGMRKGVGLGLKHL